MLTVYGATGYTGRLISRHLAKEGVAHRIAGRSSERLHRLRDDIALAGHALPEIRVVELDDRQGLEGLAQESRVILSCAGPFAIMGPPVVDACIKGGAHYLDITGEVRFMVATALRDAEAKVANVALVNAVGFDVVPSDFVAWLAADALGGDVDAVDLVIAVDNAQPSAGTMRSIVGIAKDSGLAYVDGVWVEEKVGAVRRRFLIPNSGDCEVYSAPIGDVATAPRTTGAKQVRTFARIPSAIGRTLGFTAPIAGALARSLLGSYLARTLGERREGPDEADRRRSVFTYIAEARKGSRVATATISGTDMYGLTVLTATHAARTCLDANYTKRGALSPMQAADPASWRKVLEAAGCNIKIT